ncbi:MAG: phosphoglycerate kinase [Eubacteriaceae bacterium]|nr:phosphoglycerate kinase [Eubacteriaceae bacterium]
MMKKTVKDVSFKNKTALIRADFNVPIKDGVITSDKRIKESLPTIQYVLNDGGKVILCSHLGRPKDGPDKEFSLEPVAKRLSELLGIKVLFANDDKVTGSIADEMVKEFKNSDDKVLLLQNTRFRKEETKNAGDFAKQLASYADIFVNDAFGTAHRAHSSNVGVCAYLPGVLGLLMEKEVTMLSKVMDNPKKPIVAIFGGAKVSDKIGIITNFINKVDTILIGGAMMFTFLKAQGLQTGKSLTEEDKIDVAKEILAKAKEAGIKFLLPVDVKTAKAYEDTKDFKIKKINNIDSDEMGLDIGPDTMDLFAGEIKKAATVVWNGPMGVFEFENFAQGTLKVAQAIADNKDCFSVVGGGDSASAVKKLGFEKNISHISTGGGASLEFLEGITLPGIEAMSDK